MIVTNVSGISAVQVVIGSDGMPEPAPALAESDAAAPRRSSPMASSTTRAAAPLHALDAATGNELWHDTIGGIHWESPIVANGVVYITDGSGHLTAYGL